MRISSVITKDISGNDKSLVIERMTHERHLAASTLSCVEMHMAAIQANLYTLQHKRAEDPELDEVISEIEGICTDVLKSLQYDELELEGAMDKSQTRDFVSLAGNKAQMVFKRLRKPK
jgi:hypothetical protein